jgi:hypothetical protein
MTSYASYTRNTRELLKQIAHKRRYRQVLDLVTSPLPTDRVLDCGCADGHLFSFLVGKFERRNLVGCDPNPKLLSEAVAFGVESKESRYLNRIVQNRRLGIVTEEIKASVDEFEQTSSGTAYSS